MSMLYRYVAVEVPAAGRSSVVPRRLTGETSGTSEADVRAALRRVRLQVIELTPLEPAARSPRMWAWLTELQSAVDSHIRGRRREARADWADGLATMLRSGVPLLEAVGSLDSAERRSRSERTMLASLRESLKGGASLAQAMREHPRWFDQVEIAMVEAGQHGGTLDQVLTRLAERHEHRHSLQQKLVSALAYPAIVAVVGLGVALFLSVRILPQLDRILAEANVPTPLLTRLVMGAGQMAIHHGWWVLPMTAAVVLAVGLLLRRMIRRSGPSPASARSWTPAVMRRLAVADFTLRLSELVRVGVPLVDSMRVLAPTTRHSLRSSIADAANRMERGEEPANTFDDDRFFNGEYRRLVQIGTLSGELPELLERLGERRLRQCRRLIDRWAAFAEPLVILLLAVLVGIVVMAAVLPLVRMREVI